MNKFHVTPQGRTEPCGATKRACPLGAAQHYESRDEAITASIQPFEDSLTVREATIIARQSPSSLRDFYDPSAVGVDPDKPYFNSGAALRSFAGSELGSEAARTFINQGAGWTEDAIVMLADPEFVDDDEWRNSIERRSLAKHLPETLRMLEADVDVANFRKLLSE